MPEGGDPGNTRFISSEAEQFLKQSTSIQRRWILRSKCLRGSSYNRDPSGRRRGFERSRPYALSQPAHRKPQTNPEDSISSNGLTVIFIRNVGLGGVIRELGNRAAIPPIPSVESLRPHLTAP